MKKAWSAWLILGALAALFYINMGAIVRYAAERSAKKAFPESEVRIARAFLGPSLALSLEGVSIRSASQTFTCGRILARTTLRSLLARTIESVDVHEASILITPAKRPAREESAAAANEPLFRILTLRSDAFFLRYDSPALAFSAEGSFDVGLDDRTVRALALSVPSLRAGALQIKDIRAGIPSGAGTGRLTVGSLAWTKLTITGIGSPLKMTFADLELPELTGTVSGGRLSGSLRVDIQPELRYYLDLRIEELGVARALSDLKMDEKVEATGTLAGSLAVKADASGIGLFKGSFNAPGGGDITIKDKAILKDLAARTRQPAAIIEESFKNYRYDRGEMGVSLAGNDLGLLIDLEGAKGKRNFNIVFHDVFEKPKGA